MGDAKKAQDLMQDLMQAEMLRLKQYFPYRIVWGAIDPVRCVYQVGANATKRQVNDLIRKGWEGYTL